MFTIEANLIDLFNRRIVPASIAIENQKIHSITEIETTPNQFILPGFVDAHVHIESSMLVPTEFARIATLHGTVATISDPHEIANVCGMEGVQYMIDNARQTPFKVFFGAPSCVPATSFETAGATLDADAVKSLAQSNDIWYLSEMMNYPGVLQGDASVMAKIAAAKAQQKPIDGHAPAVRGAAIQQYSSAGISTDHESTSLEEALEKISYGMHCLIREGSAAKNFDALIPVLATHPHMTMFCSDDKHPDELMLHHINNHVKRALALGYNLYDVLQAACVNPVLHYQVPVGLLRVGDPADFIIVNNLTDWHVLQTYIDGEKVAEHGVSLLPSVSISTINNFSAVPYAPSDFLIKTASNPGNVTVIEALDGQLITRKYIAKGLQKEGYWVSDTERDILKIAVINRYQKNAPPAIAFIKNFGLKSGAIASTVAHDCHNIIAVGVDDESLCASVNKLIDTQGGISVAFDATSVQCMPLPIAGLMSDKDGTTVATAYAAIDSAAKQLGCTLKAPFMTLSFMALLVIPELKLSDKGLFDGNTFTFVE